MNEIYGGLSSSPVNKIDVAMSGDRTITFGGTVVETPVEIPEKIVLATISLQTDPASTGTVTGGGVYQVGTQATVVATPDAQSEYSGFGGWYNGETKVSENASYTFTVSGACTLVAKFKDPTQYENIVGSYVYSDGSLGRTVKTNIVGVVAIAANCCPDNKARIIPISGAQNNLKWTNSELYEIEDITNLGVAAMQEFPYRNSQGGIAGYTTWADNDQYGPLFWIEASDAMKAAWENNGLTIIQSELNSELCAVYLEGDYGDNDEYLKILPEPILANGTVNPALSQQKSGVISADWTSGDINKTALSNNSELFAYVNAFSKEGFPAGMWSIPTVAEQMFIFAKYNTIITAIQNANGDASWAFDGSNYRYLWSSTLLGCFGPVQDTGAMAWGGYGGGGSTLLYGDAVRSTYSDYFSLPLAKLTI